MRRETLVVERREVEQVHPAAFPSMPCCGPIAPVTDGFGEKARGTVCVQCVGPEEEGLRSGSWSSHVLSLDYSPL